MANAFFVFYNKNKIKNFLMMGNIKYGLLFFRMKYSPQQQQKERKSESDVASVIATPSRTSRSRNSTHGCSSNRIINNTISTGIFAWMRVFRMASLLHQIGC